MPISAAETNTMGNTTTPIVGYVNGEEPFRYMGTTGRFILSACSDAYTLNYSADGATWDEWGDQVPAGENLIVTGAVTGMFFKLVGQDPTHKVSITY